MASNGIYPILAPPPAVEPKVRVPPPPPKRLCEVVQMKLESSDESRFKNQIGVSKSEVVVAQHEERRAQEGAQNVRRKRGISAVKQEIHESGEAASVGKRGRLEATSEHGQEPKTAEVKTEVTAEDTPKCDGPRVFVIDDPTEANPEEVAEILGESHFREADMDEAQVASLISFYGLKHEDFPDDEALAQCAGASSSGASGSNMPAPASSSNMPASAAADSGLPQGWGEIVVVDPYERL